MARLKVSILGPRIGENCFFAPQILGAHMSTPIGDGQFQEYRIVWQSFTKIGPGKSKNRLAEKKKEKITRSKC